MGKSQPDVPRQRHAHLQPAKGVQVRSRAERRFRRRHRRSAEHPDVGKCTPRRAIARRHDSKLHDDVTRPRRLINKIKNDS